jgi:ATP-dependent Lhr-like helicase
MATRHGAGQARLTLERWFHQSGWRPAPFQRQAWSAYLEGGSGLIVTPTGSGKTLAAFGGPLLEALKASNPTGRAGRARRRSVRVLWITPLRALAADTSRSLRASVAGVLPSWTVVMRTSDATARERRLALQGGAEVIVTTPESFALMLSYPDFAACLASLQCVVVDEWHELLDNKRGVLLQLCLARVRTLAATARIWGLSASLGNVPEAASVLLPHVARPHVISAASRAVKIETLLPALGGRFPWAGHLGLQNLDAVCARIASVKSSILFANTRAHAELWFRALSSVLPATGGGVALHHGSLDASVRAQAEEGLRTGSLRCVVATSSLELGVDFPAVDVIFQVGSPKGVARLLQRAGRSKHRPGEAGAIVGIPTQAIELAEFAAAREALRRGYIEPRRPLRCCADVLAQHCVTLAVGGGFNARSLLAEVRGTHAFRDLTDSMWGEVLDFIVQGGSALVSYPEYHKVERATADEYHVRSKSVAGRHRLTIGTIASDAAVRVRFLKGGGLGLVEEQFIARLRPGDRFYFAGRSLVFVRLEQMTAYVRSSPKSAGTVPRWQGGRMPLSSQLAQEVQRVLAGDDGGSSPEMKRLGSLLRLQRVLSSLPKSHEVLAENLQRRDGQYLMVYPFAGRAINEGIAAIMSLRWLRETSNTLNYAANDYGLVIAASQPEVIDEALLRRLLSRDRMTADLQACVNTPELARRQFREIARVAGLTPPSLPGRQPRSARQLQASSGLLYDVLRRYDPGHILLRQADQEMLSAHFDFEQLQEALERCEKRLLNIQFPRSLTPLSFPLWAERWRGEMSSERWQDRVRRAAAQLEQRSDRVR